MSRITAPWRSWFEDRRVTPLDAEELGPRLRPTEHELLSSMRPATRELLAARTLLRRIDTKVIFPRRELAQVLYAMRDDFDLVHSGGALVGSYRNVYFDTEDRRFFQDHRRGVRPRQKVRIRHYVERQLGYVEIKNKDKYRTISKSRLPHAYGDWELGPQGVDFVLAETGGLRVSPCVYIAFPRMTLVCREVNERLTIDLGVSLRWGDTRIDIPDVVIGEIKQERFRPRTPGMLAFRSRLIRPQRISKYCVSMSLLERGLPVHRFRRPLRELRRQHHA